MSHHIWIYSDSKFNHYFMSGTLRVVAYACISIVGLGKFLSKMNILTNEQPEEI